MKLDKGDHASGGRPVKASPPRIPQMQVVRFLQISHLLLRTIWIIFRTRRRVMQAHPSGNEAAQRANDALLRVLSDFRDTAPKLGVVMIKFGQFLSSRVDLLSEQAIALLSSLQDDIPPEPFEHVYFVLESELGKPVEEVFSTLEHTCTAAASLGQVHKAVLASTGEVVAVKVQRPHIDSLVRADLRTLKYVIWVITHLANIESFIDLMGVLHEFERSIYQELDYVHEAANAKRFAEMFKDDPLVYVPRVYDQYVSRHLLVLEWIDGIKINHYAALDAAGVSRVAVVKRTIYAYFYQFFEAGFFHADPHPGNIFVKKGSTGEEPIITFVDFGMMNSHTTRIKQSLREVFLAFIARDARSLMKALAKLGFIGQGADLASIEQALEMLIERYHGMTLGEISKVDIVEMVQDAAHLFYGQPFHIPAQFAFTGRAISTLVGVSTELAPEFNFLEIAAPYARQFLGLDAEEVEQALYRLGKQLLDTGKALLTLPCMLEQVLSEIESGQMEVDATHGRIHLRKSKDKSKNGNRGKQGCDGELSRYTFAWPFLFGTSLAGGIFLLADAHQLLAGWFCLVLTGLTTVRFLMKN